MPFAAKHWLQNREPKCIPGRLWLIYTFLMSFSSRSLISVLACATLLVGCSDDSSSSTKPVFKAPSSTAQSSAQTATQATSQADAASPAPETKTREESSSAEETTSSAALVSPEVPADVRAKIWNGGAVPKLAFTEAGLLSEGKFVDSSFGPVGPSAELVGFDDDLTPLPETTVDNFRAFQGDIDGDGEVEVLATIMSTGGGTGYSYKTVIFNQEGESEGHIEALPDMQIQRGGLILTGVEGNTISFGWIGHRDSDPLCCGSLRGSGDYLWDGQTLIPQNGAPHFN